MCAKLTRCVAAQAEKNTLAEGLQADLKKATEAHEEAEAAATAATEVRIALLCGDAAFACDCADTALRLRRRSPLRACRRRRRWAQRRRSAPRQPAAPRRRRRPASARARSWRRRSRRATTPRCWPRTARRAWKRRPKSPPLPSRYAIFRRCFRLAPRLLCALTRCTPARVPAGTRGERQGGGQG